MLCDFFFKHRGRSFLLEEKSSIKLLNTHLQKSTERYIYLNFTEELIDNQPLKIEKQIKN